MKVAAFLPAKGSSDRIPNKNTALLDGKPLFLHTLEKLLRCSFIDEVWLDTESDELRAFSAGLDCRHLHRDPRLAANTTDGHALYLNEVEHTDAEIVVQILCTSPFILPETIQKGIELLKCDSSYDSVVLVRREKQYHWGDDGPLYGLGRIPNSVDLPYTTIETMGMYMTRRETALRLRRRFGERPYLLVAEPEEAVDVNFPADFRLAQHIAAGRRERERNHFRLMQRHLSSPILSDILDDLKIASIIRGLTANLPNTRVLGRASTLHLRPLAEKEAFEGIYAALASYDRVVPGDLIMIQNDLPEYAYFGEINANLALRSGAVGAVIGGMTRDTHATMNLGFPTFSTGCGCKDVRCRATLHSIGKPILMNGVRVRQGDLVFADAEGVVVIPMEHERKVMSRALEVMTTERKILTEILRGAECNSLLDNFGGF